MSVSPFVTCWFPHGRHYFLYAEVAKVVTLPFILEAYKLRGRLVGKQVRHGFIMWGLNNDGII